MDFDPLFLIIGLTAGAVTAVVLASDAGKRKMSSVGWGLLGLLLPILAIPLYIAVRQPRPAESVTPRASPLSAAALARIVAEHPSLEHSEHLARALGYQVDRIGGSWLSSPRIQVVPPAATLEHPTQFENWEMFHAWCQKELCPRVL